MKLKTALPIYGISLVTCYSRGILEFFLSKPAAYALQFTALLVSALVIYLSVRRIYRSDFLLFFLLFVIALISISLTITSGNYSAIAALSVTAVNLLNLGFLVLAILVLKQGDMYAREVASCEWIYVLLLRILSAWVVGFSIGQYLGYIEFAGAYSFLDNTRLSGAFGSMQHLSITLSLLSLLNLATLFHRPSLLGAALFAATAGTLILAFTRIGYMIFGLSLALYAFAATARRDSLAYKRIVIPTIATFTLAFSYLVVFQSDLLSDFYSRLLSIDVSESSNAERIDHWRRGIEQYLSGPLLFGNTTGIASQLPNIIFFIDSFHYESGQIQYLVNFGLFFWIIVASLFFRWMRLLPQLSLIRYLPAAIWLALYVYMFNEIVPVFVLFPLISISSIVNIKRERNAH